jgi:hypothetical protein
MKLNSIGSAKYNYVLLLKWQFTVIFLVTLKDYPALQILSLLLLQSFIQIYLVLYKPFEDRLLYYLTVVNEFLVTLYLLMYTVLTDKTSDYSEVQDQAGIVQVAIIYLAVVLNIYFLI